MLCLLCPFCPPCSFSAPPFHGLVEEQREGGVHEALGRAPLVVGGVGAEHGGVRLGEARVQLHRRFAQVARTRLPNRLFTSFIAAQCRWSPVAPAPPHLLRTLDFAD